MTAKLTPEETRRLELRVRQQQVASVIFDVTQIVAMLYAVGWILDFTDMADNCFITHPYHMGSASGPPFIVALFGYLWIEGIDILFIFGAFALVSLYLILPLVWIPIKAFNNKQCEGGSLTLNFLCLLVLCVLLVFSIITYDTAGTFDVLLLVLIFVAIACWLGTHYNAFVRYGVLSGLAALVVLGAVLPDEKTSSTASLIRDVDALDTKLPLTFLVDTPADDVNLLQEIQAARMVNNVRRSVVGSIRGSLRGAVISPLRSGAKNVAASAARGARRLVKLMKQVTQLASDWVKAKLFPRSRGDKKSSLTDTSVTLWFRLSASSPSST